GVDASYHKHIEAFLKNNEIEVGHEAAHSWKGAVFAGNELMFGRVGILMQIGVYVKQASLLTDKWYQKVGGNFYLWQQEKGVIKECAVGVYLKTHKAQAELSEFALS